MADGHGVDRGDDSRQAERSHRWTWQGRKVDMGFNCFQNRCSTSDLGLQVVPNDRASSHEIFISPPGIVDLLISLFVDEHSW